jgi:putative hydrolase of the HAD superfamily
MPTAGPTTIATMSVREGRGVHPGVERLLVAPTGHHQPGGAVVDGLEQLEALESVLVVDRSGTGGESLGQLVTAVGRHGDGVDLDDGHGASVRAGHTEAVISLIGLDGDDTLWHSESYFAMTEDSLASLLAPYANGDDLRARMLETERRNLRLFGYGIKGFTLSMIETAIELSKESIPAAEIQAIIDHGKALLDHPIELLDGVDDVIADLGDEHQLVIITKGDLFHQESKVAASGLAERVSGVEIVAEKDESTYRRILHRYGAAPDEFVMIGNSVRSDVLPVIEIGGWAAHVPYHVTWELEVVEAPNLQHDRFWALESIRDVPALVRQLGGVAAPTD